MLPDAPIRAAFEKLRPRKRHHKQWMVTRSFGQVIDEVEQRVVGPLDVFEDHHRRASPVSDALEE